VGQGRGKEEDQVGTLSHIKTALWVRLRTGKVRGPTGSSLIRKRGGIAKGNYNLRLSASLGGQGEKDPNVDRKSSVRRK